MESIKKRFQSLRKGKYPSKKLKQLKLKQLKLKFQSLRKGKYPSKQSPCHLAKSVFYVSIPEKREIPFEVRKLAKNQFFTIVSIPEKREIPFEDKPILLKESDMSIVSIPEKREIPFEVW